MPKYICKVLLEGCIDASYDENTSILDDVFKYIDSTKRFNTFQELIDTSIMFIANSSAGTTTELSVLSVCLSVCMYVCLSDTYVRNAYVCTCVRVYVNAYLRCT